MANDIMEKIEEEVKERLKAMDELGEDFDEDFMDAIQDLFRADPKFAKDLKDSKKRKEIITQLVSEIS